MLPPSTVLAVYGLITQQDIGKLFQAGILPGPARDGDVHGDHRHDLPREARPAADRAEGLVGRAPGRPARRLGAAAAVRAGDRRPLWRRLHADRGGRRRRVRRLPAGRAARPAGQGGDPRLAAAGHAHGGGGVHRADRRAAVRLLPHHHPGAAEGDGVPDRPRHRHLRRAGPDHGDVPGAGLPDGRHGDDHPHRADHLPGGHRSSASTRSGSASSSS